MRVLCKLIVLFFFSFSFAAHAQTWQWAKQLSGSADLEVRDFSLDKSGNLLVLGIYNSDFTIASQTVTSIGGRDIYLTKYASDGTLLWINKAGSTGNEDPFGVTVDNDNNVYICGGFSLTASFGSKNITSTGNQDIFLAKYKPDGSIVWAKDLATGTQGDRALAITHSSNGYLYLTGMFKSSPITFGGSGQPGGTVAYNVSASGQDQWVAKYDTSGSFYWAKQFQTTNSLTVFRSIAVDLDNNLYVGGGFYGNVTVGSTYTSKGLGDLILFKLNSSTGAVSWVRQGGGTSDDQLNTVKVGPDNCVYITGYAQATGTLDSTATKQSSTYATKSNSPDILLAKYSPEGRLLWKTLNGDAGSDNGYGLAISDNLVFLSGYFCGSVNFNGNTISSGSLSNLDTGFYVYDTEGNPVTAQSMQGALEERGQGVGYDGAGNAYIAGYYLSNPLTVGSFSLTNTAAGKDVFVTKYANPFSAAFTHKQNILCNGSSTGELTVTPYFGTYPYTYAWTLDGSPIALSDSVATGLAPGTYAVTVTDFNGSIATTSTTITQPTVLAVSGTTTATLTCYGDATGTIDITSSGGVTPYQYFWNTTNGNVVNETTEDQSGLIAGTYIVTLTDKNGCSLDKSFTITQPQKIVFKGSTVTPIDNVTSGAVNLNVTGGTPAYSYSWSSGPTTKDISGLVVGGDYKVTLSDSHSCVADTTFWVDDQRVFYATLQAKTNVLCKGGSTGTATIAWANSTTGNITVTVSGQTPQVYSSAFSGTHQATGLAVGSYTATVADGVDTKTVNFSITEPASVLSASAVGNITTCYGGSDGIINLTVIGGTSPYSYLWSSGGATTQYLNNKPIGPYSVVVTDANGCFASASSSITQPNDITYTVDVTTPISCYGTRDGALTINNVQGGTGLYSYLWSNTLTSQGITNLAKDSYWVIVTDGNGCYKKEYQTLAQPTQVVASFAVTNPVCHGGSDGSITITPSGGTPSYTFSVNGGVFDVNPNFTGLAAGNYNVVVQDNNSCLRSYNSTLYEPADIVITTTPINPTCPESTNGSIGVSVTGGTGPYGYFWTTSDGSGIVQGAQNQSNLTPGTYTLLLTDAHSCSKSINVTLTAQNLSPVPGISTLDNPVCQGSNAVITATGGSTYAFYTNGIMVQGPGVTSSYNSLSFANGDLIHAKVISAAGCSALSSDITMVVHSLPVPTLTSSDYDNSICEATPVTFTAGGGSNYEFFINNVSLGVSSPSNLYSTTALADGDAVKVKVIDVNACSAISAPIITAVTPNVGVPTFTSGAAELCVGSISTYQATASNSAGIVYSIVSGGASINSTTGDVSAVTSDFTVRATATGINGCGVEIADMAVTVHALPTVDLGGDQAICAGSMATLDAGTFASYLWSDNSTSQTLVTGSAGNYSVTVTDLHGCSNTSAQVALTVNALPTVNLGVDRAICQGATTTLDAGSFASYLWSDNSTSQTLVTGSAGNYSVTVTDLHGCSNTSAQVALTVNALPTVNLGVDRAICQGATTTLDAGSFASYLWSDNSTSQTLVTGSAGNYSVTVTDLHGCSNTSAQVALTVNALPTVNLGVDRAICQGATTTLDAGSFASYLWSDNSTSQTLVTGSAGNYSVTVTDLHGCSNTSAQVALTVNALPTVNLGVDRAICQGATTTLDAGSFASYLWSDNSTSQTLVTGSAGNYSVTVTDLHGCSNTSAQVALTVNALPTVNLGVDRAICQGATTTLDAGSFASYLWSDNSTSQTLVTGSAGNYSVTVTDLHGCSNTSAAVTITVNPVPVLDMTTQIDMLNTQTRTIDAGSGFTTYLWQYDGGDIGTDQTYDVDGSVWGVGSYTIDIKVTNTGGCSSMGSVLVNITLDNGVSENKEDNVSIYPNPASSTVYFSINQKYVGIANVKIVSVTGAIIFTGTINFISGQDKVPFNVQQLKSGSYFVIVSIGSNRFTKKLIIR